MKASNRQDSKIRIVETEAITVEPERIDEKTEELRFGQQVLARMEKNRRIAIKKGHRKKIDDDNHATFRVIQKPDLKNTFVYVIHACGILESQSKILEALTKNYDCHDAFRLADMSKEEPR